MRYLRIHTLEKRWYDKDEVFLHAAFQLLTDFIEQEKPDKTVDWNGDELHRKAWQEIKSLYDWWRKERPARKSPLDDNRLKHPPLRLEKVPGSNLYKMVEPGKKKYANYYRALREHWKLEQRREEEDQCNLHRLIDIPGDLRLAFGSYFW
jgi:hypothetical protein